MLICDDLLYVTPGEYKWVNSEVYNSPKHNVLVFSTLFKTIDLVKCGWWKMISVEEYKGNPKEIHCLSCQKQGSDDNKIYSIGVGRTYIVMMINLCEQCKNELKEKL